MSFVDIRLTSFLFLPLLSFLILIFFGNKFKDKSHYPALFLIGCTLLNAVVFLIEFSSNGHMHLESSFEWFNTSSFKHDR